MSLFYQLCKGYKLQQKSWKLSMLGHIQAGSEDPDPVWNWSGSASVNKKDFCTPLAGPEGAGDICTIAVLELEISWRTGSCLKTGFCPDETGFSGDPFPDDFLFSLVL